jgi:predicted phosphodiesterase
MYNTKSILVLSDCHFPYQKKEYFSWIKKLKEKIKPTMVLMIGDLIDAHSISQHLHSPELKNIKYELEEARSCIKKLRKIFNCPMPIIWGNHDIRIQKLAEKSSIPNSFIKDINEILGINPSWKWTWHNKLILNLPNKNKVFFTHHFKSNVLASAKELGLSLVVGHQHTKASIELFSHPLALNFAMCVGSSIEPNHEAFKYGKNFIKRPIISCGSIINSIPQLRPMFLNKDGKWTGQV